MIDDRLEELLRVADAGERNEPPQFAAGELLAAALRRRRSHTRRRKAAIAAVTVVAAASVLQFGRRDPVDAVVERTPAFATPRRTADKWRAELARLDREATIHEQVVRAPSENELDSLDDAALAPLTGDAELLRREAARSAAITWQYATLVEQELNDLAAARREYERVAQRFPGTRWAELAAVSLRRLSAADGPAL